MPPSLNFMNEDQLLSPESLQIRESVRQFVTKEVTPLLKEAHRDEKFPVELIKRFAKMGLLGPTIQGYGCAGVSGTDYGIMMQELERADSGIRSFCSVQGSLVMYPIYAFGSEAQKKRFLEPLAQGEMVGCFGLTEPDAGSNPGGLSTKATQTSSGYLLNGNKMWITNGSIADIAIVWAKLDGVVRGFIVEKNAPGFSTTLMQGKFSLRVSVTSELHFKDCLIPKENILPEVQGLKGPLSCLTQARFGIAWGVIGAAEACFDQALSYTKERQIFDRPLSSYQLAQAKLVACAQQITLARLLAIQLGQLKDSSQMTPSQVSMAKMNNCRMALDVARTTRDLLGANGIIDEYPIMRHMMNLETVNTYEGTEDIHRLIIGQALTGESALK